MSKPAPGRCPDEVLARVVREHAGRLAASLVSLLGDFSAAEDLVQDAVEAALQRWPVEGIPDWPDAWLFTVARRRGLDVLRRESNTRGPAPGRRHLAEVGEPCPGDRGEGMVRRQRHHARLDRDTSVSMPPGS